MKIWAATRDENKIIADKVMEFPNAHPSTIAEWGECIGELCREMDLSRPVILKKHLNDLNSFRHTAFTQDDFMEHVAFKRFTVELFPEKKRTKNKTMNACAS